MNSKAMRGVLGREESGGLRHRLGGLGKRVVNHSVCSHSGPMCNNRQKRNQSTSCNSSSLPSMYPHLQYRLSSGAGKKAAGKKMPFPPVEVETAAEATAAG